MGFTKSFLLKKYLFYIRRKRRKVDDKIRGKDKLILNSSNKLVEPINYPVGNSLAHFKRSITSYMWNFTKKLNVPQRVKFLNILQILQVVELII